MGWASGSELLEDIARSAYTNLSGEYTKFVEFGIQLIDIFEHHDCDTIEECYGIYKWLDEAIKKRFGYDPNCEGRCYEVQCDGEHSCGCCCHVF